MRPCSRRRRRRPVVLPDPPTHSPNGECLTCHDTGQIEVELMPGVPMYAVTCPLCKEGD